MFFVDFLICFNGLIFIFFIFFFLLLFVWYFIWWFFVWWFDVLSSLFGIIWLLCVVLLVVFLMVVLFLFFMILLLWIIEVWLSSWWVRFVLFDDIGWDLMLILDVGVVELLLVRGCADWLFVVVLFFGLLVVGVLFIIMGFFVGMDYCSMLIYWNNIC